MYFGPVPVDQALGGILAHSVTDGRTSIRKGTVLAERHIEMLVAANIREVTIARPGVGDILEDVAAGNLAQVLFDPHSDTGLTISTPFTGRANILSAMPGLFRAEASVVHAINAVHPSITLATLPDRTRVQTGQMVATVKIIPYAVSCEVLKRAIETARLAGFMVAGFKPRPVSLILTRISGMKESLIAKGRDVVAARLAGIGFQLEDTQVALHEKSAVSLAIQQATGEIILILGASATSDEADICPSGLIDAGGKLTRFGMPVDPGNLLFLGKLGERVVVGLPGCARSPALNGADWVLERLAVGEEVSGEDISTMGYGGLLKEIPQRPQPRTGRSISRTRKPKVAALVLAGGQSRRMKGLDKLLEQIDGEPLLRHVVRETCNSQASEVVVVLPPDRPGRVEALSGLGATILEAPQALDGMAGSIRAGLAAVQDRSDAVLIVLADMPEVRAADMNRLIAGFDPTLGQEICRASSPDGTPGHPVLFGRRFFEALADLHADRGARSVVVDGAEFLVDIRLEGNAAVLDLDTPEDWELWRTSRR